MALKNRKGEMIFQGEDVVNISQGGLTNTGLFQHLIFLKFLNLKNLLFLFFFKELIMKTLILSGFTL